jgi:RNA polymerase sigma-70 factor (ECF subfamily)
VVTIDLMGQAARPMLPLAEALAAQIGKPVPDGFEAWAEQALALLETFWPGVKCEPEKIAPVLAGALSAEVALDELAGPDLLLAACCLAGDPRALEGFDHLLSTEVRRAVGPIDPSLVDDVTQLAREKLLVGSRPRLAEYSGRGALSAWLRAVAARLAFNAKRPGAREQPVAELPDQPLADPDPELALLRARYRDQFRGAFAVAVKTISSRERTLLRLTTLDGLRSRASARCTARTRRRTPVGSQPAARRCSTKPAPSSASR